jgi:pSer/pThr/pTyr-binding forkhead associated (FHA) protein
LNDALVSREHFGIEKDGSGKWVVIDLGSRNGTILNGRRLSNEIAPLKSGDKVCAGSQTFVFLLAVPKKSEQDILNEVKRSVDSGKDFKTMMDEIVHTQTQIMKKISYPT